MFALEGGVSQQLVGGKRSRDGNMAIWGMDGVGTLSFLLWGMLRI